MVTAQKQLKADLLLGCSRPSSSPAPARTPRPPRPRPRSSHDGQLDLPVVDRRFTPAADRDDADDAVAQHHRHGCPDGDDRLDGHGRDDPAVTLTGTVNPQGLAHDLRVPVRAQGVVRLDDAHLPAPAAARPPSRRRRRSSGLTPATTYIYRLVARIPQGTSAGLAQTLHDSHHFVLDRSHGHLERTAHRGAAEAHGRPTAAVGRLGAGERRLLGRRRDRRAGRSSRWTQARLTVASAAKAVRETGARAPRSAARSPPSTRASATASAARRRSARLGQQHALRQASSTSSPPRAPPRASWTIANLAKLEVVAGFAEVDASKVQVGQPATITLSALPTRRCRGKVTAVDVTSTVVSNVVTYDVTITLTNPPAGVQPGMTANVSVVVGEADNVLELPTADITTRGALDRDGCAAASRRSGGHDRPGGRPTTGDHQRRHQGGDVVVAPTVSITAAPTGAGDERVRRRRRFGRRRRSRRRRLGGGAGRAVRRVRTAAAPGAPSSSCAGS